MGYLYRPKLKSGRRSEVWWAKYYSDGRAIRESTGVAADTATPPVEARRFLKTREGRVATGQPILPRADRVRYELPPRWRICGLGRINTPWYHRPVVPPANR